MPSRAECKARWFQTAVLSLISLASVAPLLAKRGLDIVTLTYTDGANRLASGLSPYLAPDAGRDWFKYSPAFAWLYQPLTWLPASWHVVLWAAINAVVFWRGVSAWFRVSRRMPWLEWVALVAAAMELDISLRYQQVNALIAGLMLLGLALYRDGRWTRAGAVLGVAADLKVLPVVFLGGLAWPPRMKYVLGAALSLALLFAMPALSRGWIGTWHLHREWWQLLGRDLGETGLLDLRTVVQRLGAPELAELLREIVMVGSVLVFGGYRLLRARQADFDWGLWYAFGAAALLLLSPRTESPTFVLIAPAYLLLALRERARECGRGHEPGWRGRGAKVFLVVILVSITIVYTDVWPKALWNPKESHYISKTFGAVALWAWVGTRLAQAWWARRWSPAPNES